MWWGTTTLRRNGTQIVEEGKTVRAFGETSDGNEMGQGAYTVDKYQSSGNRLRKRSEEASYHWRRSLAANGYENVEISYVWH